MATSNTTHKIPTVTEIVSNLNLQLRQEEKLAEVSSLSMASRMAALVRAEQITYMLYTITGNREWEHLMFRFRQDVTRRSQQLVEKTPISREEVHARIEAAS